MALESIESGNVIASLAAPVRLPKMAKVRQIFDPSHIKKEDIPALVANELSRPAFAARIKPGATVAVTCGSRGVANIAVIVKAIVDFVRSRGAIPFVFPAMGSHGGATAEGQIGILSSYGVTQEFLGCEIRSSMETVQVGAITDGTPVFIDKNAYDADAVILCGRVKAHTLFHGPYESGLYKMAVIGMGKQHGAEYVHAHGCGELARVIPEVAKVIFDNSNVIGGVAVIENAFDQTCALRALLKEEIADEEPKMLLEAKSRMGRIYLNDLDVLVIDYIGKNISGDGMDPNVTGRFSVDTVESDQRIQRIAVLDLTDETHGNCNGIGLADVITKKLLNKIDVDTTYPNAVTSSVLSVARIPLYTHTDLQCIQIALRTCTNFDRENPRIVRITDTMRLGTIYVSEAMLPEVRSNPNLELLSEPEEWPFDENGNLW